jgi:hypothetical protein
VVAPVRPDPVTPKQMEAWWADLAGDGVKTTQAVLALYARPKETVAFLKDKLQPLKADKEQVKKWLAALGSDKAEVWKPAFEKLRYFDPRLALDLRKIPDQLTTPAARQRLGAIMADEPAESLADLKVKTQVLGFQQDGKPIASWGLYFYCYSANPQNQKPGPPIRVISCASNITTVGDARHSPRSSWTRAARAAVLLEHIGSPQAVAILKDMAAGHPDALPTRTAKEALARLADRVGSRD